MSSPRPCSPKASASTPSASANIIARDFAISAPEVVLAAIAGQTERILLGSAVTVLSTDDPVRVFQRFSTLNAISNGRAEVILGRGSFTESYPLFGYDLSNYDELFEEKLALFVELLKGGPVTWSGQHAVVAPGQVVYPPIEQRHASYLGRRRRQPRIGGARRAVRLAADARDHRRQPAAIPAVRRSVSPVARAVRHSRRSRWPCTRPATSRRPTIRRRADLWPHYEAMMTRIGARTRMAAGDPRAVRARGRS